MAHVIALQPPPPVYNFPSQKKIKKKKKKGKRIPSMAVLNKSIFISLAVLAVVLGSAQAQYDCASKLVDCYKFINSTTKPDNDCCSSIKNAVNTQLKCLCTLYTTPGLLQSFNITLDQALNLSAECNASTDLSACNSM